MGRFRTILPRGSMVVKGQMQSVEIAYCVAQAKSLNEIDGSFFFSTQGREGEAAGGLESGLDSTVEDRRLHAHRSASPPSSQDVAGTLASTVVPI